MDVRLQKGDRDVRVGHMASVRKEQWLVAGGDIHREAMKVRGAPKDKGLWPEEGGTMI